jgi:hypothetical protein
VRFFFKEELLLDFDEISFANGILGGFACGLVFSVLDVNFPGYHALSSSERKSLGKKFCTTVKKGLLDASNYRIEVVVASGKPHKPQLYRKIAIVREADDLLLKDADIYQILGRLGDLVKSHNR